jgi:hypothetical protein
MSIAELARSFAAGEPLHRGEAAELLGQTTGLEDYIDHARHYHDRLGLVGAIFVVSHPKVSMRTRQSADR